ncbi:uncharacterized protein SPPG_01245 [Spizellomyces punctatus DAOM BR117]|uniref:WW domain-containing protein n=1 Tax=Spizellomyces punctatus (strain DAOM BR117) TaxID=645134 RepID=A0A0L0HSF6_SPIPD|nr:uncharacterized protein SPPG_01245 [Spizellomyces punctatus DAOM BR117]KND03789.1 hypothetical protein SPPG_01245 [Spizellomyces punctatus DAOM BR117]|eukprot:XP_016611828.1 hypothetical protein SPPG_01245 [Spizellomyces punctatus DAOM BR117]
MSNPQTPPPLPPNPAKSQWQSCWDETSQLYYWWNTATNETTWEDPNQISSVAKPKHEADQNNHVENVEAIEDEIAVKPPDSQEPVEGTSAAEEEETSTETSKDKSVETSEESQSPIDQGTASNDYYNSEEYYNWYYSQYLPQSSISSSNSPDNTSPPDSKLRAGGDSSNTSTDPSGTSYLMQTEHGAKSNVIGKIDYSDYTVTGAFNSRTGRFQNIDRDPRYAAPDQYFDQSSKAIRQMNFFFDYDKFQEERAAKRLAEMDGEGQVRKQQKLTKKDIEFYKQRKKEKKLKSLKARFGGD